MGIYFFSLDYLVGVVQRMHEEKIITKSFFYNRTGINIIVSRMINAGLVRQTLNPFILAHHYKGTGRRAKFYQLNCRYQDIRVGDLFPLLTKINRHEEHVFRLMAKLPIEQLVATRLPKKLNATALYSAEKALGILFFLSTEHYTRCDDMEHLAAQLCHRRTILADLVKTGLVEVKRGEGYRLKKPLSHVRIEKLLPMMYSRSTRKQSYNTLIYLMRDMSVDTLNWSKNQPIIKE